MQLSFECEDLFEYVMFENCYAIEKCIKWQAGLSLRHINKVAKFLKSIVHLLIVHSLEQRVSVFGTLLAIVVQSSIFQLNCSNKIGRNF